MKKQFFLCCLALGAIGISSRLQAQSFEEGQSSIQVGYGFGNFIQAVFNAYEIYDDYSFKATGPAFLKYEYGVTDKIGLGLNVAYASAKVSYRDNSFLVGNGNDPYEQSIKWNTMSFLARMNFHFANSEKFDPYAGFGMGFRTASWSYEDNDPDYDNDVSTSNLFPFGFEMTIGARYYISDNFGIYAETGLAKAVIQLGLNLKL